MGDARSLGAASGQGRLGVGLFSRGGEAAKVTLKPSTAGTTGKVRVRDVWAHEDKGTAEGELSAPVEAHGVALFRFTP